MKARHHAAIGAVLALALGQAAHAAAPPLSTDGTDPKTWDPKTDGPVAASANHKVVFESDTVRVMSVTVQPGESEHLHAHLKCAVLVFDRPTKVIDRDGHGKVLPNPVLLGQIHWLAPGVPKQVPFVWLQPPEALHSITNVDKHALHLTRIELKNGCAAPPG